MGLLLTHHKLLKPCTVDHMLLSKEGENKTYRLSTLQQSKHKRREPGAAEHVSRGCKSTTGSQIFNAVFDFYPHRGRSTTRKYNTLELNHETTCIGEEMAISHQLGKELFTGVVREKVNGARQAR